MLSDRLTLALESGAFSLPPEGDIAVIGARIGDDISELPKERVHVIQPHFTENRWFQSAGYETHVALDGAFSMSILRLPRSKDDARKQIASMREQTDGLIVIDGQKTDGIDSMLKELRRRADVGDAISKAHGKIFAVSGGDFSDWANTEATLVEGRFQTVSGVFSADGVDPGSLTLSDSLPDTLKGHVVDLGAGWGYLSDAVLKRDGVVRLDLVEADHRALGAAEVNIDDPRAKFFWADARTFKPETPVDHVVTNPPFHAGRAAEPTLGQAFIRSAAGILARHGQLWLVANRHLPYEATLEGAFRTVRLIDQTPSFKVFNASGPRSPHKG